MKSETLIAEHNRAEFWREPISAAPTFQLALHSQKPEGLDQSEHELVLPGYGRVSVDRSRDAWTLEGASARNAKLVRFGTILSGRATVTWLSLGIGGQIRRLVKLESDVQLGANRRIEFDAGEIEIEDLP